MTPSLKKLSPQLARVFFAAGLLDAAEWGGLSVRPQKHKPILDVLAQDVSLGTFRDLLNARLTLKVQPFEPSADSGLYEGLTATGMLNDEELRALLITHRPAIRSLLEPLVQCGGLDMGLAEQSIHKVESGQEADATWLVEEGIVSAPMICQALSHLDIAPMRLATLHLALYLLWHNRLLEKTTYETLLGQLTPTTLEEIRTQTRERLGRMTLRLAEKLEEGLDCPTVDLATVRIEPDLAGLFPQSMVRRQLLAPFAISANVIGLAIADPLSIPQNALIHWLTGRWPQPCLAPGGHILERVNVLFGQNGHAAGNGGPRGPVPIPGAARMPAAPFPAPPARGPRFEAWSEADPVSAVQLVSSMIESAIELRTTDIHIEPQREGLLVRYRIDGELHRVMNVPAALAPAVISRVKVLAAMDVTERRRPQDGHFELRVDRHNFDFRISTLPAIQGEKLVIRILDEKRVVTGLDQLGLLPRQRQLIEKMVRQPYGLILVTGPTGGGKTSTLYAALNLLNQENRNLVTIEDPVEYQLEGINQVQVDPHIGLTFSEGLRSILRQDPDVIMVGEIRDGDTAYSAIRAAMTGHLVFSTLHTNSALGAIDALVHLGSVPFMVAGALLGIVSQRLVRRLCESCRQALRTTPSINQQLGLEAALRKRIFRPVGCAACFQAGYLGRTGVFEVIHLGEALRPLIIERRLEELERSVREAQMISLQAAGAQKILAGITSVDEITRKVILDS